MRDSAANFRSPASQGQKVLVVDDDPDIRKALQDYLKLRGHGVEAAENGRRALEQLEGRAREFAVVFTDLNMPEMDGLELLQRIYRLDDEIVQIVITGNATRQTAINSLKSGAYDFIEKPFQLRELEATLGRALEHYRLVQENHEYQRILEDKVTSRTQQLLSLNETLTQLCRLGQKSRETLNIKPKLEDFEQFCRSTFQPDTFILYTYHVEEDRMDRTLHYDSGGNVSEASLKPPKSWMSLRQPRLSLHADLAPIPADFHLQEDNRSVHLFKLEQDMLLGFLYVGFNRRTDFGENQALLDLYLGEIESALIHEYLIASHREEFRRMFLSSIKTHARTIEVKDYYTRGHCERVERYVDVLAKAMELDAERQYNLKVACILHDIGKIGVPEQILSKPGKLTREEFDNMKEHPVLGGKIVRNLYGFDLEDIIRHHHENYDGSGYPDGLKGEDIPLESRIMSVMDTFDAMTTTRPYRSGRTIEVTVAEITRCSGTQFDPQVVEVFRLCLEELAALQQEFASRSEESPLTGIPAV